MDWKTFEEMVRERNTLQATFDKIARVRIESEVAIILDDHTIQLSMEVAKSIQRDELASLNNRIVAMETRIRGELNASTAEEAVKRDPECVTRELTQYALAGGEPGLGSVLGWMSDEVELWGGHDLSARLSGVQAELLSRTEHVHPHGLAEQIHRSVERLMEFPGLQAIRAIQADPATYPLPVFEHVMTLPGSIDFATIDGTIAIEPMEPGDARELESERFKEDEREPEPFEHKPWMSEPADR